MSDKKYKEIKYPHIIACEGVDACNYICAYLETLYKTEPHLDCQFTIMNFEGNSQLSTFLKTLKLKPNYNIVKSVIVLRDAETDAKSAAQSVKLSFDRNGFLVPDKPCVLKQNTAGFKTGYALFPALISDETNGTLEDLCISTLSSKNAPDVLKVADNAVDEVENKFGKLTWHHKSRLHTYLSLNDAFVGLKLGQSANANAYNFFDSLLEPLKILLQSIFE